MAVRCLSQDHHEKLCLEVSQDIAGRWSLGVAEQLLLLVTIYWPQSDSPWLSTPGCGPHGVSPMWIDQWAPSTGLGEDPEQMKARERFFRTR